MARLHISPAAICLFAAILSVGIGCATATAAAAAPTFTVQGRVYCDTCRAGFITNVTSYIEGAKVKVECKNFTTGEIVKKADGVTDKSGTYSLDVKRDHEDEICEVVLVESPDASCNEVDVGRDRARIVLTRNVGIVDNVRFANSLGYLIDRPFAVCPSLLKSYLEYDG